MKKFVLSVGLVAGALAAPGARAASSLNEIREVLQDRKTFSTSVQEQEEIDVYRAGRLPQYKVTLASLVSGGIDLLTQSGVRTTTEKTDYYPRLTKLVHPNGICFTGEWVITEPTDYSGYFAQGKKGLFVGRASTTMSNTEAGELRGFGFAGKLFATEDASEVAETAHFFTVDVGMGTKVKHFTDTALTNEPEIGFDFNSVWLALKVAKSLAKADENPGFRPLYLISELGLKKGEVARTPHWIKIAADPTTVKVDESDFRNELDIQKHYPKGMKLLISVSETTKDRSKTEGWKQIGYIQLNESFVSYGCDRQVHFAHPKLHKL